MLPTTTASSGPTKVATKNEAAANETPDASAMPATPRRRSATVVRTSEPEPATSTMRNGATRKNGAS